MAPTVIHLLARRFENCTFTEDGYLDESSCYVPFWSTKVRSERHRSGENNKVNSVADRNHSQVVALPRHNSSNRALPSGWLCARSEKVKEGPAAPRISPSTYRLEIPWQTWFGCANTSFSSSSPVQHSPELTLAIGQPNREPSTFPLPLSGTTTTCRPCPRLYMILMRRDPPCTNLRSGRPSSNPINSSRVPSKANHQPSSDLSMARHPARHRCRVHHKRHMPLLQAPRRVPSGLKGRETPILSEIEGEDFMPEMRSCQDRGR
jgi:hypothetical protein